MNTRLFIITVRWKNPMQSKWELLERHLDALLGAVAWLRVSNFCWLVKGNMSMTTQQINVVLDVEGLELEQVLIFQVDRSTRFGWAPKWVWDWIETDRPLIEGAPMARSRPRTIGS